MGSTSDLRFFSPAASSFQPKPYAPNSTASRARATSSARTSRSHDSLVVPRGMDPLPSDPHVIFIHPPFNVFPDSHLHPDGVSYALLAENPEWFLVADDFISQKTTNPNAIPYPPHLEPPRGWCPAKKKDLKERGADGWPEGEEPRLRCTFCRRQYAGVNAKSMWRRHVFEKHKIAMSNRRDGNDRPRGRGSGKENKAANPKHSSSRSGDDAHDKLLNLDVTPQSDPQCKPHKSKFRSLLPADEGNNGRAAQDMAPPSAPSFYDEKGTTTDNTSRSSSTPHFRPSLSSPPLTPQPSSDPVNMGLESSDGADSTSPAATALIPPSPYDPRVTPSFRHSPPRLPSDQPWRFASPSHPLHAQSKDVTLCSLIREATSPQNDGLHFGVSPVVGSSPTSFPLRKFELDTPLNRVNFRRPGSRKFLGQGHLPSPLSGRLERYKSTPEQSPLSLALGRGHKKSLSMMSDEWSPSSSIRMPLDPTDLLIDNDPFVSMFKWPGAGSSSVGNSPLKAILGGESPVVRSASVSTGAGLGIGLLEPFSLPELKSPSVESDCEFSELFSSSAEETDEAEVAGALTTTNKVKYDGDQRHESSPPLKKRRTSL